MPLYEYECPQGHWTTAYAPMAESRAPRSCSTCGQLAEKRISAARVVGDYQGYDCPITGKWIEGRRAHEENLKRHGCRVYEAGETRDAMKFKEDNWKEIDKKVDHLVEATASELNIRS